MERVEHLHYHLQEAGATPAQELAFALANAISLLDLLKARGTFTAEQFERASAASRFFVNAGIRFVEEMCKMRAFGELWDELHRDRFGVTEPEVPACSATACRSTRSASPRSSPRTTPGAS